VLLWGLGVADYQLAVLMWCAKGIVHSTSVHSNLVWAVVGGSVVYRVVIRQTNDVPNSIAHFPHHCYCLSSVLTVPCYLMLCRHSARRVRQGGAAPEDPEPSSARRRVRGPLHDRAHMPGGAGDPEDAAGLCGIRTACGEGHAAAVGVGQRVESDGARRGGPGSCECE
jgi:hypothetical protein